MAAHKNSSMDSYLQTHKAVKGEGFTHTRIGGDKNSGIFAGSYKINDSDWKNFMEMYYQQVFVKGQSEHLTEKQLIENGPVLVDIDLRYETEITTKQHTKDHIIDAVMLYAEKMKQLLDITEGSRIEVFVMEKNDVNTLENKTKDGIHIIFGIQMHKALQVLLRKKVLPELKDIWDGLPITNDWEDVLDEGVTKGFVNWQVYGSRKPANQTYLIKYHFDLVFKADIEIEENLLAKFSTEKYIYKLSARYTEHPAFPFKAGIQSEFEAAKLALHQTSKKADAPKHKIKIKLNSGGKSSSAYADIDSEATLDNMLETMFDNIGPMDYRLKETHEYAMSLPASYYGPGSYSKWLKVGMALHNTKPELFLTWLKFSCQENCRDTLKGANGKFDWRNVPELYEQWTKFTSTEGLTLTYRSIMYWSKNDAREKYDAIRTATIDFFIDQSIQTATEFDLASVLYNMFKDRFACVSVKNKIWFEYINHRWHEIDSGNTLRLAISKEMHQIYFERTCETTNKAHSLGDPGEPGREKLMKVSQKIGDICTLLKKTQSKQNIMREACELFYDKDFMSKLDRNQYLLCFNNGVVDFKQKLFRKGQPDDFLSKCTNIDYVPYNPTKSGSIMREINDFMSQLFPVKELENYMWDHLASCLIGINTNQTFHVYKGSGRNGKSALTSLMSKSMGSYKGTVPISLITGKRNAIGTKGDKINEGTMKELTGGTDPIQARALFKDTITFVPQFKLVVCTNTDFEDTSNDDGTWRRMRYIDFMSKFLDNPYQDEIKFPRSECPYQFPLDKKLEERFEAWAPVFMSALVQRTYENLGLVKDCHSVMANSDKHREGQDYFTGFAKDKLRKKEGEHVKKTALYEEFKKWYIQNYGKDIPKGKELNEFMDKRFGIHTKAGWSNIELIYDEHDEVDDL
jgi:P4 family phage/plasmid primase-like protien